TFALPSLQPRSGDPVGYLLPGKDAPDEGPGPRNHAPDRISTASSHDHSPSTEAVRDLARRAGSLLERARRTAQVRPGIEHMRVAAARQRDDFRSEGLGDLDQQVPEDADPAIVFGLRFDRDVQRIPVPLPVAQLV